MTQKILFLRVPGADDDLGQQVAEHLPDGDVVAEFCDLAGEDYDAVLDRLQPGVLPVILRAARG